MSEESTTPQKKSRPKGFAGMSRDKVRAIASAGGRASQACGKGHRFEKGSELARRAGSKGGIAYHENKKRQGDLFDDAKASEPSSSNSDNDTTDDAAQQEQ